jgi:hypothetical protein
VPEPGGSGVREGDGEADGDAEADAEADGRGVAERPGARTGRGDRVDAPSGGGPAGAGPTRSTIRPGTAGGPGRGYRGAADAAPGGGNDPLACGGRIVMATAPSMMYTSVPVTAMITGGSSSSGCDRNAVAPLRKVAVMWSARSAAAKPAAGSRGP